MYDEAAVVCPRFLIRARPFGNEFRISVVRVEFIEKREGRFDSSIRVVFDR